MSAAVALGDWLGPILETLAFVGGEAGDGYATPDEVSDELERRGLSRLTEDDVRAVGDSSYVSKEKRDGEHYWDLSDEGDVLLVNWQISQRQEAQALTPVRPGALSRPSALADAHRLERSLAAV